MRVAYHSSGWKDERVNDYDKPAPEQRKSKVPYSTEHDALMLTKTFGELFC
jgi:hypothetical protein